MFSLCFFVWFSLCYPGCVSSDAITVNSTGRITLRYGAFSTDMRLTETFRQSGFRRGGERPEACGVQNACFPWDPLGNANSEVRFIQKFLTTRRKQKCTWRREKNRFFCRGPVITQLIQELTARAWRTVRITLYMIVMCNSYKYIFAVAESFSARS